MSAPMKPVELTVVDTNTAEWQLFPVEYIKADLEHVPLMDDPDTGMMILKMVYRAGFTNPWHSHPCAHGVYVLEGTLNTHQGRYPAGSFVWFPEGGVMEHGATQDALLRAADRALYRAKAARRDCVRTAVETSA